MMTPVPPKTPIVNKVQQVMNFHLPAFNVFRDQDFDVKLSKRRYKYRSLMDADAPKLDHEIH